MHELMYGDINSRDYKVFITNAGIYKSPEKRYKEHTVAGRSGKLLEDTGTFENIDVEYPICVYEDSDNNLQAFLAAMLRKKGYQRIEDTFHQEYYRMGAFLDEYEPNRVTEDAAMSNGVIKFKCLPQKFLKSGEEPLCLLPFDVTQNGTAPENMYRIASSLMPVPEDRVISYTLYRKYRFNGYLTIVEYDSNENVVATNLVTLNDVTSLAYNETITFDSSTVKWKFIVDTFNIVDTSEVYADLICEYEVAGETRKITMRFADKITIANPTGFSSYPLIEYLAYGEGSLKITNNNADGIEEFYEIAITSPTQDKHVTVDCDMQYVYDSDGVNVSNSISIITAENSEGQTLVFPKFGDNEIEIELRTTDGTLRSDRPNIVCVYPRWWTV